MALIVLVERNRDSAERHAGWLDGLGHTFRYCGGPHAPDFRCPFQQTGSCDLWKTGELFIYDACLDCGYGRATARS